MPRSERWKDRHRGADHDGKSTPDRGHTHYWVPLRDQGDVCISCGKAKSDVE